MKKRKTLGSSENIQHSSLKEEKFSFLIKGYFSLIKCLKFAIKKRKILCKFESYYFKFLDLKNIFSIIKNISS